VRRRDFIKAVAGSAAAWPFASPAQQSATPVIGFLHLTSLELTRENLASFRRGLGETGYIEDRNVAIEYRWAQGRNDQLPTLAAELVRRQVSVIVVLESLQPKQRPKRSRLFFCKPPTRCGLAWLTISTGLAEISPALT
jgi:ABC-type uncharacterized transport system substrate-binding protein